MTTIADLLKIKVVRLFNHTEKVHKQTSPNQARDCIFVQIIKINTCALVGQVHKLEYKL